jgi:hypothetical protein
VFSVHDLAGGALTSAGVTGSACSDALCSLSLAIAAANEALAGRRVVGS